MGGRITAAVLDSAGAEGGLLGRVSISRGLGSTELSLKPAEAVALALDARAPIRATRDLLDVAGISSDDLRSMQARHTGQAGRAFKVLEL